jgi:hypothetical protein
MIGCGVLTAAASSEREPIGRCAGMFAPLVKVYFTVVLSNVLLCCLRRQ